MDLNACHTDRFRPKIPPVRGRNTTLKRVRLCQVSWQRFSGRNKYYPSRGSTVFAVEKSLFPRISTGPLHALLLVSGWSLLCLNDYRDAWACLPFSRQSRECESHFSGGNFMTIALAWSPRIRALHAGLDGLDQTISVGRHVKRCPNHRQGLVGRSPRRMTESAL